MSLIIGWCSASKFCLVCFFEFSTIHSSWSAFSAERRSSGLKLSIFLIMTLASRETSFHSAAANENLPVLILSKISLWVLPLKGGYPQSRMYMITPQLHTSHFSS